MHKILIANRGEIAIRVMRSARALGYRSVAVYSEADADALHVRSADEAVPIGPATAAESYLNIDRLLAAAARAGADAIHPGYGFLSEHAGFARACEQAGITFIGPPADAIELMGSKRLAKNAMLAAGVPCIPGYQGAEQSQATLKAQALELGFPLMIKASAGGGGRGMRLAGEARQLDQLLSAARSEAQSAFGDGELILERALPDARHIEVQIFADRHGNAVHLGERDCSIQRRHQKVIEEAPSPFVDETLRRRIGEAAVEAARSCSYVGAGTVEFLVDRERNFYFLEMNTRLQVEHPVTELITGQDLVAWQLAVAAGEPLPLRQDQITMRGHAIEVRLYAEDPRRQFTPQTGTVHHWQLPEGDGVRADCGMETGHRVTPFYDPMLAKLIATGQDRAESIRRLAGAVQDLELLGVGNNRFFLQQLLYHPVFRAGDASTAFIDQDFAGDASLADTAPPLAVLAIATLLFYHRNDESLYHRYRWRAPALNAFSLALACDGHERELLLSEGDGRYQVSCADECLELELVAIERAHCVVVDNGLRRRALYAFDGDTLFLDAGSGHFSLENITRRPASTAASRGSGRLIASMDGAVVEIAVSKGDRVERGQTLVVIDAMKMEHQLKAAIDGVVRRVAVSEGDQVRAKTLLVQIDPTDSRKEHL